MGQMLLVVNVAALVPPNARRADRVSKGVEFGHDLGNASENLENNTSDRSLPLPPVAVHSCVSSLCSLFFLFMPPFHHLLCSENYRS